MKRIELDFLEKRKFRLENEGVKLGFYAGIFILGVLLVFSLYFKIKIKTAGPSYERVKTAIRELKNKVASEGERIKSLEAQLLPKLSFLNSGLERRGFSYTEVFHILEKSLPSRAYLTELTVSSNGKVVFTGYFASSSSIKSFVESLSAGGKYQVYLMREERKAGGSVATIAWDLKGGGK